MKIFKRISCLFLMAFLGLFTLATSSLVKATDGNLYIHYFRYDKNFSGWHVWLWPEGGAGAWLELDQTDEYGVYGVKPLSEIGASKAGFIVAKGEWTAKDPDGDRYADLTQVDANGDVHVYCVTGTADFYYERDAVDTSHRFLNAYFTNIKTVKFSTTTTVKSDITNFKLLANGETVTETFSFTAGTGTVTLPSNADLSKTYTLSATIGGEEKTCAVTYDGIYGSDDFNDQFYYDGNDLGAVYSQGSTTFKLWAPISKNVELCLYEAGHTTAVRADGADEPYKTVALTKGEKGVWSATVNGDLSGIYYTYKVTNGSSTNEVVDPYAKSTGVNGKRGMIVDFNSTKATPDGWADVTSPAFSGNNVDAIIYELHVRDLTTHKSWKGTEDYRGTFMGIAEKGTTYTKNGVTVTTGLDHLIELGITHVQLLPIEEFPFVDETRLDDAEYAAQAVDGLFNWGYMTDNYNTIEGSYCTDPYDGYVRIKEYRTMIKALHENGIRVNMDVVYNHTAKSSDSNFNLIVPGYYHRLVNGQYSNGSGCGNETASDHAMMRKFIVDSICFWTTEYDIDGYRFDLMSLHDVDTMNAVYNEAAKIEPGVMVYGEPWTGGTSALSGSYSATKGTMNQIPNVGSFCDLSRDGYKATGQAFESGTGFIFNPTNKYGAKFGISGGAVGTSDYTYVSPNQQINYIECHDNWTVFDKAALYHYNGNKTGAVPDLTDAKINSKLAPLLTTAGAMLLTSQGIAFMDSGQEMLRTKKGDENSYNKSDAINQLDWGRKISFNSVFQAYKELINIRKSHESLRMTSHSEIKNNLTFLDKASDKFIAYEITSQTDTWEDYIVLHNPTDSIQFFSFDSSTTFTPVFTSVSDSYNVIGQAMTQNGIELQPYESVIVVKSFKKAADTTTTTEPSPTEPTTTDPNNTTVAPGGSGCGCSNTSFVSPEGFAGLAAMLGLGGAMFFAIRPKKKELI